MPPSLPYSVSRGVAVPMRDRVELLADIYQPSNLDQPLPVLLMRLPYGRAIASTVTYAHPSWYAAQGFIVVIQAVRGCDGSGGTFYPFQTAEISDAQDTIAWCRRLPQSNGRVGMYGFSYQGVTQFMAAGTPGLLTICPAMATLQFGEGWNLWGGALALDFVVPWAVQLAQDQAQFQQAEPAATILGQSRSRQSEWLDTTPLVDLPLLQGCPFAQDWLQEPSLAQYSQQQISPSNLPALHIAGWADPFLTATLAAYTTYRDHSHAPQHLVIGPWQHLPWAQKVGEVDFGREARSHIDLLQIQWFNYWLKQERLDLGAPVQVFEMGANQWHHIDHWPPPTRTLEFWLESDGFATGPDSSGSLSPTPPLGTAWDSYVYDPRIATPATPYGPYDQRPVQQRRDLLTYTLYDICSHWHLCGSATLRLWAASTAPCTDWVVKLSKIENSGRVLLLTAGVLRAYHQSDQPQLLEITLRPTFWYVRAAEAIQLCISSAAYPWLDRNPNSGQWPPQAQWSDFRVATQTVLHGGNTLSSLSLPFLDI